MSATIRRIMIGASVLALAACASTTFTSTWHAPGTPQIDPVGKTVCAVFVSPDVGKRRAAEDTLATDITEHGAHGVAAYTLLPNDMHADGDAARAKLKEAGCNGAVVMRVVGHDKEITYTPGMTVPVRYGGFGPYWGYGWGAVQEPGYLTTDTIVSVETLVYSLTSDKLLWAGTSRTTNPGNLDAFVQEVAAAAAKEMQKQGLLPPGK